MKNGKGGKRKKKGEETEWLQKGGDVEEGLIGNEMMRGSDEVKVLEENWDDFKAVKDNPSLLIVWFVFSYCTDQTHCGHLAEPISAIHKKKMLFF